MNPAAKCLGEIEVALLKLQEVAGYEFHAACILAGKDE